MDNLNQLIAQASQFFINFFREISHFTDKVFISGILEHLWGFLKAIIQFMIIALETLVRILKFFVH